MTLNIKVFKSNCSCRYVTKNSNPHLLSLHRRMFTVKNSIRIRTKTLLLSPYCFSLAYLNILQPTYHYP